MDLTTFIQLLMARVPQLSLAVIVFVVILVFAIVVRKTLRRFLEKSPLDKALGQMFASCSFYGILAFGVICALGTAGVNVSVLVASLGLGGFAIGMALKDALGSLVAGILILLYRPFKIGDRIKVSGFEGEVRSINLRYTVIKTADSEQVLIPNKKVFEVPVEIKA